jgi:hypothetical protein
MGWVIDHTLDQLNMIYAAHLRETARVKIIDMNILSGVISAAFGKGSQLKKLGDELVKIMQGDAFEAEPEDTGQSRQSHVERLMQMGAKTKK